MVDLLHLHHVRLVILEILSEVKVTFDVGRKVPNIETPRNLMNVNWLPEGLEKKKVETHSKK